MTENILTGNTPTNTSPFIVEVIGLAGTGKTSLSRALCQQNKNMLPGYCLQVRNVRHMPYFLKHTMLSLPTFLRQPRNGRRFSRREIVKILNLRGWHRILKQQSSKNDAVLILDQGPIYDLATLHAFGPERLRSQHYKAWWERTFNQWAHTVELVIWLDAPEEILLERIRSRDKWHPVKERPVQEMRDYLLRYQTAYEHVMTELAARHDIKILHFDTGTQPLEDTMSQILAEIRTLAIAAYHYEQA